MRRVIALPRRVQEASARGRYMANPEVEVLLDEILEHIADGHHDRCLVRVYDRRTPQRPD